MKPETVTEKTKSPLVLILALIGAVIAVAMIVYFTLQAVNFNVKARDYPTGTVPNKNITAINVDVPASEINISCAAADSDSAANYVLTQKNVQFKWSLEQRDTTLYISHERKNTPFFSTEIDSKPANLTIPAEHCDDSIPASLDAVFTAGAGTINASAKFRELKTNVDAGEVLVNGSATNVNAKVAAGQTFLQLRDVTTAEFMIVAGNLHGSLTGKTPKNIAADIVSGDLELKLPAGAYETDLESGFGEIKNDLRTPGSGDAGKITVKVKTGEATLSNQAY